MDDAEGIQKAIDHIKAECTPTAGYTNLSRIALPAGRLDVSREIKVDADFLLIKGAGNDPTTGTKLVYTPNADTRYDTLTADGSDWDKPSMTWGDANGGWLMPGRGLFRIQSTKVHQQYRGPSDPPPVSPRTYDNAPPNRKDLFEGTVNVHWRAGRQWLLPRIPGLGQHLRRKYHSQSAPLHLPMVRIGQRGHWQRLRLRPQPARRLGA
ncbi:hypothetical protein ACQP1W_44810 [Spirillospora sp. CA-255316]